jgi:tRNA(Ile)-lysidine synthase
MAPFGPFEPHPELAVAVSGGADSLALCLLAQDWAVSQGGGAVGLTVDHGLRPESGREARLVRGWLRARGIPHRILRWEGPKPESELQAAAREARYRLLLDWCRARGVLHLLLAHHEGDQAETVLLRLSRGSGLDGLAGMPAVREGFDARILRPLLPVSKDRLKATLRARGQEWIEDPSNVDLSFARARVRSLLPRLAAGGLELRRIAASAQRLGAVRRALEDACARLLAAAAAPCPAGYLWLEAKPLAEADDEVRRRALLRCLLSVSGAVYGPRQERLDRLAAEIKEGLGKGRTLGGCRIVPMGERLLVCRETRGAGERVAVEAGMRVLWDGRFDILLGAPRARRPAAARGPRAVLARLGSEGWRDVIARAPKLRESIVPAPARLTLPALWAGREVIDVPHLGFRAEGAAGLEIAFARWTPPHALMGPGFPVAETALSII